MRNVLQCQATDIAASRMAHLLQAVSNTLDTQAPRFYSPLRTDELDGAIRQLHSFLAVNMAVAWAIQLAAIMPEHDTDIYTANDLTLSSDEDSLLNSLCGYILENRLLPDYKTGYIAGLLGSYPVTSGTASAPTTQQLVCQLTALFEVMERHLEIGQSIVRDWLIKLEQRPSPRTSSTNLTQEQIEQRLRDIAGGAAFDIIETVQVTVADLASASGDVQNAAGQVVMEYTAKSALIPILYTAFSTARHTFHPINPGPINPRQANVTQAKPALVRDEDTQIARFAVQCVDDIWQLLRFSDATESGEWVKMLTKAVLHYLRASVQEAEK